MTESFFGRVQVLITNITNFTISKQIIVVQSRRLLVEKLAVSLSLLTTHFSLNKI